MKILWLAVRPLLPADTGGKIRSLNTLKGLARRHEVSYLTFAEPDDDLAGMRALGCELVTVPWREAAKGSLAFYGDVAVNLFSPLPYIVAKYTRPEMTAQVRSAKGFDLLLCDFLQPSANVIGHAGGQRWRTVLFQHNVESQVRWRQLALEPAGVMRLYLQKQCERLERYERDACRWFDHVLAVSEQDAALMREKFSVQRVSSIPTGVDTVYFQPSAKPVEEDSLVFVGSMDWQSNEDGVMWFVEEVLSRIRSRRPKARLVVVGRNPTARLQRVCEAAGGISVTGRVDDVRPYVERAALYVVPLLYGGGTRIKIFEALAQGKAVVSTTLGAEGLQVENGKHLAIADGPEAFAARCGALLGDANQRARLGAEGRALVESRYGWEAVSDQVDRILESVVRRDV